MSAHVEQLYDHIFALEEVVEQLLEIVYAMPPQSDDTQEAVDEVVAVAEALLDIELPD